MVVQRFGTSSPDSNISGGQSVASSHGDRESSVAGLGGVLSARKRINSSDNGSKQGQSGFLCVIYLHLWPLLHCR